MPIDTDPPSRQHLLPSLAGANGRPIRVQPRSLLCRRRAGEGLPIRVPDSDKRLFPVKDRWVLRIPEVSEFDVQPSQIGSNRRGQGWMGLLVEVGVGEIGDFWLDPIELDERGSFDRTAKRFRAALVHAEQGSKLANCAQMDVECLPRELPDRGLLAGPIDRGLVAGAKQQRVSSGASLLV